MIARSERVIVAVLVAALAACASAPRGVDTTAPDESTVAPPASTTAATVPAAPFPTATFSAISEDPVIEELAAKFQAALDDAAGGGGMSATVMTAEGTWSGTAGKADGVRDLMVDDQFAIASITKSVVAAQVMLMVEAGELALDDTAAEHLPRDLRFDVVGRVPARGRSGDRRADQSPTRRRPVRVLPRDGPPAPRSPALRLTGGQGP